MTLDLEEIKKEQKEQSKMLNDIHNALIGTPYTDNKGMIDAVNKNTSFRRNSSWYAAFFTTLGISIKALYEYLKIKFFT
jgi:hypothetical protein